MYKLMRGIMTLVDGETGGTTGTTGASSTSTNPTWLTTLTSTLIKVINPILIVASLVGVVYAIWVGITFIRADDKNARDEAKQKLIYVIIGIVVMGVLIALFYWLYYQFNSGNFSLNDLGW